MDVANGDDLPSEATLILHVPSGRQIPRGGPCERIDQDAFRCDEDGISVTCVDLFDEPNALSKAAVAMKGDLVIRKSGVIALVTVDAILTTMTKAGRNVRVVRDVQPGNEGHCLITGIAPGELGHLLALSEAFVQFIPAADIDGLLS